MNQRTARMGRGAACIAGFVFCWAGCGEQVSEPPKQPPPEVTISKPVTREVTDYFEFPGQIEAVGEVEVRARVTGYLTKVNFVDGQNVKKGDLLYEIDPRPYQAELDRAKGELARQGLVADDRPGDQLREEHDVQPEAAQPLHRLHFLPPHVRDVRQRVEGEKRDPQRKMNFGQRQPRHVNGRQQNIQISHQKRGVFERREQDEIGDHPRDDRAPGPLAFPRLFDPSPDEIIDADRTQNDKRGPPLAQCVKKNARPEQDKILSRSRREIIDGQNDRQKQEKEARVREKHRAAPLYAGQFPSTTAAYSSVATTS